MRKKLKVKWVKSIKQITLIKYVETMLLIL